LVGWLIVQAMWSFGIQRRARGQRHLSVASAFNIIANILVGFGLV